MQANEYMNDKLRKDNGSEHVDEIVYRQLVGSLLYLTAAWPYIMFATSLLARYMHKQPRNISELQKECSDTFKVQWTLNWIQFIVTTPLQLQWQEILYSIRGPNALPENIVI